MQKDITAALANAQAGRKVGPGLVADNYGENRGG